MAASAAEKEGAGLNAKQRRLLKRQRERGAAEGKKPADQAAAVPAVAASTAAAASDNGGLNAKQRRLLKRAGKRVASVIEGGGRATKKTTTAMKPPATPPGSAQNAKQRRLMKRAQERLQGEAPPPSVVASASASAPAPAAADIGGGKKRKRGGDGEGSPPQMSTHVPHVVFVGQLSFKTTAEQLRAHLEQGGVTGAIQVRLLTDKKTRKSKGQAFVTLADAERQFKCLALHHTKLDGRVINVERSCGGKNAGKRKEKIQGLREEQREVLRTTCDRILKEKLEAGLLKEGELDEQATGLLTRCVRALALNAAQAATTTLDRDPPTQLDASSHPSFPPHRYDGATAAAVLEAYCNEDRDRVRERKEHHHASRPFLYLTHHDYDASWVPFKQTAAEPVGLLHDAGEARGGGRPRGGRGAAAGEGQGDAGRRGCGGRWWGQEGEEGCGCWGERRGEERAEAAAAGA